MITVIVPDERLNKLVELVNPQNVVPAVVENCRYCRPGERAGKGAKELGNKFLSNIRETDAIIHVLRCFDTICGGHVAECNVIR